MDQTTTAQNPSLITTALIVVTAVFPIISAISIGLRILARRQSKQKFYADDYCIFASWFLTLPLSILAWVYASRSGVNYYNVDFLTGTEDSLELIYLSSVYVQWPLAAVKIGVLLFYKRIFTTPIFRTVVWCAIALIATWGIVFFILVLIQIDPVAFPLTQVSLRFNDTAFGLAQVATSFTLDIIVLCLPLPVISRLNMKRQRKLAIILIFWLGAFCAVAAIVRTVLLNDSIREVISSSAYQRVSNQSKQYIFLVIEPNCSILAASLPTYGPLFTGGRAPESFIRSLRSVFSIRSFRSSGSGSRGGSATRKTWPTSPSNIPKSSHSTESQVELRRVEDWPGKGRQEVYISYDNRVPPLPSNIGNGISVTNGVSVQTE
ncbi:putative Integral membrane protein [Seiridium cardinale]|uniref:Integral membrane protein n=1 Tax=Seiridium cardinale TaxID=138064 RepID=A0ABR2XGS3_9PEZI